MCLQPALERRIEEESASKDGGRFLQRTGADDLKEQALASSASYWYYLSSTSVPLILWNTESLLWIYCPGYAGVQGKMTEQRGKQVASVSEDLKY